MHYCCGTIIAPISWSIKHFPAWAKCFLFLLLPENLTPNFFGKLVLVMNYQEAMAYLDDIATVGSSYGLDTMRELMRRLGNIQDEMHFIHIAGTNGKGSVLAYTASVMQKSGYMTGVFSSPALDTFRERIQVNGEYITKEALARHTTTLKSVCDEMCAHGFNHPTYFELSLALAFLYYAEKKCQIVILEVGLGGRLDATNIITPLVSVIVSISLDHTQLLGDTLADIAAEKGGIIKPEVPIVIAPQKEEAYLTLKNIATGRKSPFIAVNRAHIGKISADINGQHFSYQSTGGTFDDIFITLLGDHQLENAACAIEALECVRKCGFEITDENIITGLAQTRWAGRLERIATNPDFILDGAHNPDAALRLADALKKYYPNTRKIFILSILADKDYREILRLTLPLADTVFVTTTDNPRALSTADLADNARKYNPNIISCTDLAQAVTKAQEIAQKDDLIVAFGSLTHLGEIRHLVNGLPKED